MNDEKEHSSILTRDGTATFVTGAQKPWRHSIESSTFGLLASQSSDLDASRLTAAEIIGDQYDYIARNRGVLARWTAAWERDTLRDVLARNAGQTRLIRSIRLRHDADKVDVIFIVAEPLYDGESEAIAVLQRALGFVQHLQIDFVVLPEAVATSSELLIGAETAFDSDGPSRKS